MLRLLIDLLRLRANPQDLPYSRGLLAFALAGHVVADILGAIDGFPFERALLAALIDTTLLVAAAHTLLLARNLGSRAVQTLTALAATGALIGMVAWAVTGLVPPVVPAWAAWLPFLIWYLMVFAHVLRNALGISFPAALGLAVLYFVLSSGVSGAFLAPEMEAGS